MAVRKDLGKAQKKALVLGDEGCIFSVGTPSVPAYDSQRLTSSAATPLVNRGQAAESGPNQQAPRLGHGPIGSHVGRRPSWTPAIAGP